MSGPIQFNGLTGLFEPCPGSESNDAQELPFAVARPPAPAAVAQQAEQPVRNRHVVGSTPTSGSAKPLLTTRDVLREAKARVRELDREIKRLKKLEAERASLRRLLKAAADDRAANVVHMRKSG